MSGLATEQVTRLCDAASDGDPSAAEQLLPLVYDQLRLLAQFHMAKEPAGQTLQPTALVHEAYMRLVGRDVCWDGRAHFFAAAARAMRQILVNRALRRRTLRHGGGRVRVDLEQIEPVTEELPPEEMLALDEALEKFQEQAPRQAKVVMLLYFAGLSIDETATSLGVSARTVDRDWQFAKAWLCSEMANHDS